MYNLIQNSVPFAYRPPRTTCIWTIPPELDNRTSGGASPYFPDNIWTLGQGYKSTHLASVEFGEFKHQLAQNVVLSVSYVGNSNFHQSEGININPINPSDTADRMAVCAVFAVIPAFPPTLTSYRPVSGLGTIDDMEMGATSNYNSLQVSFRTQEWKGLTFQESYTWSHAFDIIDGELFAAIGQSI